MENDRQLKHESEIFDSCDVKRFFALVLPNGVKGLVEVRVIEPNAKRSLGIGFFDDSAKFIEACRLFNGRGNIYAGRNPRPVSFAKFKDSFNKINPFQRNGAHSAQIEAITILSLDIDPIRPKNVPASDSEVQDAVNAAVKICQRYRGACVVVSGNGSQCLFPIPPLDARGRQKWLEERVKGWEAGFKQEIEGGGRLKLDPQFDLARIVKIAGTLSVKGRLTAERPHRRARFVTYSTALCDVMNEILKDEVVIKQEQQGVTFNLKTISNVPAIPGKFYYHLKKDKALQDIYYIRRNFKSASEYDLAMAGRLAAFYNFTPSEIHSVLVHLPSRLNSIHPVKTRCYYDKTLTKAMAYARKIRSEKAQNRLKNMPENPVSDVPPTKSNS